MKQSYIFAGIMILFTAIRAQVSTGETPYGIIHGLNRGSIPVEIMPAVNVDSLMAEDANASMETPMRFAYAHQVQYNLNNSGLWEDLGNGERLWRLKISSPDAYSVSLVYSQYRLPAGAKLFIYNDTETHIIGAFTGYNNKSNGEFSTQPVQGDNIVVELYMSSGVSGELLELSHVVHDYRNIFGFGDSGSCNNNVNCPEWSDWYDQKRSVAMLLLSDNTRICSGDLINNVENDDIQYFLTANHCVDWSGNTPGDQLNFILMFNYESPGCTNQDGPTDQTVQGMTIKAMNSNSDFALLEVDNENIPVDYDVYFSGWNNISTAPDYSICIHHPNGDIKKISKDEDPAISAIYYGVNSWRIANWEDGTTETGSSGSPLFDQNRRIVGQLYGGDASCSNNVNDYFGKFSYSWNQGNSSTNRLKDWLDPNNTGAQFIDGRENIDIA